MKNQVITHPKSEDKLSMISSQISKVGSLSDEKFIIESRNCHKIKNIDENTLFSALAMILTKAMNLSGFKNKLDDIHKQDISRMLLTKFKNISLEEIDKAFQIDRYSENPIEHFQLFNATYVAKVLNNYIEWRRTTTKEKKLLIEPKKEFKPSPEQIKSNRKALIKNIYEEIKLKDFTHDAWLIYDDVDAPKKDDVDYKNLLFEKELKANRDQQRLKNPFQKFKQSQGYVKNRCKAIIVCNYLKNYTHDYEIFKQKITSN